uniref:Uncharacterized protein n=1 Tax=Solanum tuberosum TaxID=4113 RepID=M1BND3_SOLTU
MEMILQPQIEKGLRESVTSHLTAFGFLLHKLHLIDPHHLAAKGDNENSQHISKCEKVIIRTSSCSSKQKLISGLIRNRLL